MENILNKLKVKKIILFISLLISFLIFEVVYLLLNIDFSKITLNQYIFLALIKYLFFIILLIIIYHKYLKEKFIDFKNNFRKYISISFKDWFSGFLIMIVSNAIINSFITGLGENENAVQGLITNTPYIALLMTTFLAPFIEEMIFRKSLQDATNNKIIYMMLSGLIFGLVHVLGSNNPYEYLLIIPYGSLGFMFAHTINKTDNIYCTIMMHMFHNGILTILAMVI